MFPMRHPTQTCFSLTDKSTLMAPCKVHGKETKLTMKIWSILLVHNNPQHVDSIGGGEGAMLCKILKHNTIECIKMIEINKGMVETLCQYLPYWNHCSLVAV